MEGLVCGEWMKCIVLNAYCCLGHGHDKDIRLMEMERAFPRSDSVKWQVLDLVLASILTKC